MNPNESATDMNYKLQQRLISIAAASFSLALSACDLGDKNIGEAGEVNDADGGTGGDEVFDGECEPPDPGVSFSYEPLDFGGDEFANANITALCTVVAADTVDGMHLELDCPDAPNPVFVDVTATPTLSVPVLVGDTVRVRYVRVVTTWVDTYISLESESGDLLFTVVDASKLWAYDDVQSPNYNPIDLGTGIGSSYTGCATGTNQCGTLERVRLWFDSSSIGATYGGTDGSYIEVVEFPTIDIWLVAAREVENPVACPNTPAGWYQMLVAAGQP
jgi:hypothetical protein